MPTPVALSVMVEVNKEANWKGGGVAFKERIEKGTRE